MIAFTVHNNAKIGNGKVKPCAVINDANGKRIAIVPGEPLRSNREAVELAFVVCKLMNAGAEQMRREGYAV